MNVRTRMAPSPTGNLHLGTAYATLWPYLFARHNQGEFLLRIEDTDQNRSAKQFEENITDGLKWLGLVWDKKVQHQIDRLELYKQAAHKLVAEDKAYLCFCSKEELGTERQEQIRGGLPQIYSGKCRRLTVKEIAQKKQQGLGYVIRYKLSEGRGVIEFDDLLHGKVSIEANLLGDMIILRGDGVALYNFAVVVDDIDMEITHVIRGDDHLSNTPKQILFFEALGKKLPVFAHYPMVLNPDRIGKLSKRAGSTSLDDYRKDGFLAEVLINYLALVGWTHPQGKEIFSKEELIELFDIEDMSRSAAAWSPQKLEWLNGEYIRALANVELKEKIKDYLDNVLGSGARDDKKLSEVIPLIKERIKKLSDFVPLTDFLWEKPEYNIEIFKKIVKDEPEIKAIMQSILDQLEKLSSPWGSSEFEEAFKKLAVEGGVTNTQMFQLVRVAVSGQLVTPPLFESILILGEDETKNRIKEALSWLATL